MAVEALALSSVAVRKGSIYCAPFCGMGCTFAAFSKATKSGAKLAKVLGSDDWEPRVWENMGWHWSAVSKNGWWEIHNFNDVSGKVTGYTAFLGLDNDGVHFGGTWVESGDTPQEAIKNTLAKTKEYARAIKGGTATKVSP